MQAYCRAVLVPNPYGREGLNKRLLQLRSLASVRSFERLRVTVPDMQRALDRVLRARRFDIVNLEFTFLGHSDLRQAPSGERPPLIVKSHGGPTSTADSSLDLSVQFWTSRGFGVLDVNYRGSTGYGRRYREKLYGQWGIADPVDCISGARFLAMRGEVYARNGST